ncbi:hypothetical protein [Lysobacter sp. 1R34A]|uniref:hypothetical protein n=1 Tax=Lysobacter sp. 1R34A TaxID=3445786 RepID=UPI003EED6156
MTDAEVTAAAAPILCGVIFFLLPVLQSIVRDLRQAFSPDEGDFQPNASPAPAPGPNEG